MKFVLLGVEEVGGKGLVHDEAFYHPENNTRAVSRTVIGKTTRSIIHMAGSITECIQLIGKKSKFIESEKGGEQWKGKSGPQLSAAVGGRPIEPRLVPGLNFAKCRTAVSMAKDAENMAGLLLLCSWGGHRLYREPCRRQNID